ncbi:MAG TPA: acyltransferase family protein [Myxococcota bacterium]|nr:acyltransferase family protein [Myxococcota bacterium]
MTAAPGAAAPHQSLAYRRDIDGLRAVAVLSVVFYHARLPGFGGGFVGVDVFFVISGYLITQIILPEVERGRFSMLGFYERRIRRIFPALFVVLLAVLAIGCALLLPDDLVELSRSTVATTFFAANFHFLSQAGYFDAPSWTKPLLHTWSLAVEEQFYIVFPPLLLLAKRKLGGHYLALTWATVAVSLAACIVGTNNFRDADFYLAPTRAWELGIGSLLAMGAVRAPGSRALRELAAAAGLAGILYAVTRYGESTKFPGVTALPPVLGSALLLWAGTNGTSAVGRLLSTRPAVFVGLISYSLYLWHWPLLVYASYVPVRVLRVPEALGVIALSAVLATLSFRYIERPFRGARSRFDRAVMFRGGVGVSLATAAAALAIAASGGLPWRIDAQVAALEATRDEKSQIAWCNFHRDVHGPKLWARELGDPNAERASFIVWGDSHACVLAGAIDSLARQSARRGHLAAGGGCPPLLLDGDSVHNDICESTNQRVMRELTSDPGMRDVVMIGRWGLYFEGHGYGPEQVREPIELAGHDGSGPHRHEVLAHSLVETARRLAAAGKRVWVVGPVPEVGFDVPAVLARARMLRRTVDVAPALSDFLARQHAVLATLAELEGAPSIHVLLPHELLCGAQSCDVIREGRPLYWDDDHLSRAGVSVVLPLLQPIFAQTQDRAAVE